jgi:hypothetical protein
MSDLKAPTYKDRCIALARYAPVGRAFMVRHFIFLRSDIFKQRWRTTSDLKAPTYKDRCIALAR